MQLLIYKCGEIMPKHQEQSTHDAVIYTWVKPEIDVESEGLKEDLKEHGFEVTNLRLGKLIDLKIVASSTEDAYVVAEQACNALLANPVTETFGIKIKEGS